MPVLPGALKLVLRITNDRMAYYMRKGPETYVLSVDQFSFSDPAGGARTRDFMEIEIEAESDDARAGISRVKDKISQILRTERKFQFSPGSKYELGVEALNLKKSPTLRKLFASEGYVLSVVSVGVSAAGLVLSALGASLAGGVVAVIVLLFTLAIVARR